MPRGVTTRNFYGQRRLPYAAIARGAWRLGKKLYSSYNRAPRMPPPPPASGSLVKRRIMGKSQARTGGGRRVYSHRRRGKTHLKPKTVAAVKTIVNTVLSKNNSTGKYIKRYTCELGVPASNVQTVTQTFLRDGAGFVGGQPSCGISKKILDAVSILFNGKTSAMDYEITTNNFDELTLKFHIQYMSCKYVITNQTTQTYHFDLYSASHKGLSNDTLFGDFSSGMTDINQTGGTTSTLSKLGVLATQVPAVVNNWRVKRDAFELKPGEKREFFYTTHKNTLIDFEKLHDGGVLQDYTRLSESLCFSYYAMVNRNHLTTAGAVGHFKGTIDAKYGINIEVEEKYVFDAPANTDIDKDVDSICWFNDFPIEKSEFATTSTWINNMQVADPVTT